MCLDWSADSTNQGIDDVHSRVQSNQWPHSKTHPVVSAQLTLMKMADDVFVLNMSGILKKSLLYYEKIKY